MVQANLSEWARRVNGRVNGLENRNTITLGWKNIDGLEDVFRVALQGRPPEIVVKPQ